MLLTVALGAAGRNVLQFFAMPEADGALPLLDTNTRLDMLDYFMSDIRRPTSNLLGGEAIITGADSLMLTFETGRGIDMQVAVLVSGRDTTLMVIETLYLPQADSRIGFYNTDWTPREGRVLAEPELGNWLTTLGRSEREDVERMVPFMLWRSTWDPATGLLTLRHSMSDYFFGEEDRAAVDRWLRPALRYRLKGKRFTAVRDGE